MKRGKGQVRKMSILDFNEGKHAALSYLFDKHHAGLCFYAFSIVGDLQEAQDIVSECYVKLWDKRADFNDFSQTKSFLYVSCRNRCLNFIRDQKRREKYQEAYLSQIDLHEKEISHHLIKAEVLNYLYAEIETLPNKCRQVFKLLYFDGKKTSEVASIMGISIQTVRNQKTIAHNLIRTSLLKKGINEAFFYTMILWFQGN